MKTRATSKTTARSSGRKTTRGQSELATRSHRSTRPRQSTAKRSTAKRARRASPTSGKAVTTIDHEEIQQWVESHGGHPATVQSTANEGRAGGVLRIDFPGFSGKQSLREISWDEWFQIFDQRKLAFLY